jgi:hypothetical protein
VTPPVSVDRSAQTPFAHLEELVTVKAAPATSQAWAAISRTWSTATPRRSAAITYGSGAGLSRPTVSADSPFCGVGNKEDVR